MSVEVVRTSVEITINPGILRKTKKTQNETTKK